MRKLNVRFTTAQAFKALGLIVCATIFCTAMAFQGNAAFDKAKNEENPQSHKTAHLNDPWGFYEQVAVLPPLTVTEIDGNRMFWLAVGRGLHIGSLELEPGYSVIPASFSKDKHGGCYGVHYCKQHMVVLEIEELPDKFCKVNKQ